MEYHRIYVPMLNSTFRRYRTAVRTLLTVGGKTGAAGNCTLGSFGCAGRAMAGGLGGSGRGGGGGAAISVQYSSIYRLGDNAEINKLDER